MTDVLFAARLWRMNPCRGRGFTYFSVDGLGRDPHRQMIVALDEARIRPHRLTDHLDLVEALENLFPDDLELQLGKPHADAAMDTEAERQMVARPLAVDDELERLLDRLVVVVARDVPHHDLVAFLDLLAADLDVAQRGTAHVGERGLPADHLRHEALDQR